MADNVGYTPGTGATVAADEIAGVLHQRVKIGIGADGEAVDVSASNPMPISAAALPLPTGAATEAKLNDVLNKLPSTFSAANGMPDFDANCILTRQLPQRVIATSYTTAGSGVDPQQETVIATGSGMAISRTGGNLVITSGTTTNSETVIRSIASFDGRFTFSFGDTLSQRIVNNNFYREVVDVIGDNLSYTIVNSTTVNVVKASHGFTSENVGQRMDICAITGAAGIPMEGVIATIVDVDTIQFTVAGWPASGTGTCSLTGWNKIEFNWTGTTAGQVTVNSRRRGYQNTPTAVTASSTATGSMVIATLHNDRITISTGSLSIGTNIIDRSVVFTNIPEPDTQFYYQIRVKNGTTAPASTTTWTCGFTRIQDFVATQVELTGVRPFGNGISLPITGSVTSTLSAATVRSGFVAGSGIWYDDSATNLAGNATFTGTSRDLTVTATATTFANAATYTQEIRLSAESDVTGTLWLEVSRDNTNWRRIKSVATTAVTGGGFYAEIIHRPSWRYARVGYTNGAGAQARFSIGSILMAA